MINRTITVDGKQNRYRMTPAGGGSAIDYDVSYLGTIANAGTDIKDTTLLTNAVAGKFGLDDDNSVTDPADPTFASPNNAFNAIKALFDGLLDKFYPIGTIYQTDVITSAGAMTTQFGGTWVAWGAGRVPVGFDGTQTEFNTVNKTGGNKLLQAHTHTTPNHTHNTENSTAVNNATTDTMTSTGGSGTSGSTTPENTGTNSVSHSHDYAHIHHVDQRGDHNHGSAGSHDHNIYYDVLLSSDSSGSAKYVLATSGSSSDFMASAGSHTHDTDGLHGHYTDTQDDHVTSVQSANHTHTSAPHTHTLPNHTHTMNAHNHTQVAHSHTIASSGAGTSGSTGGGASENLQPYQVCYFWKRTA